MDYFSNDEIEAYTGGRPDWAGTGGGQKKTSPMVLKNSTQGFGKSHPHFHIYLQVATANIAERTMQIKHIKTGPSFSERGLP